MSNTALKFFITITGAYAGFQKGGVTFTLLIIHVSVIQFLFILGKKKGIS